MNPNYIGSTWSAGDGAFNQIPQDFLPLPTVTPCVGFASGPPFAPVAAYDGAVSPTVSYPTVGFGHFGPPSTPEAPTSREAPKPDRPAHPPVIQTALRPVVQKPDRPKCVPTKQAPAHPPKLGSTSTNQKYIPVSSDDKSLSYKLSDIQGKSPEYLAGLRGLAELMTSVDIPDVDDDPGEAVKPFNR